MLFVYWLGNIVSDDLYGSLQLGVIDGYLYNNEPIEEAEKVDMVDRGIDRQMTIVQVKDGIAQVVYKCRNDEDDEWVELRK